MPKSRKEFIRSRHLYKTPKHNYIHLLNVYKDMINTANADFVRCVSAVDKYEAEVYEN